MWKLRLRNGGIIDGEITIHKTMILSFDELMVIIFIVSNNIFNLRDFLLLYTVFHKHKIKLHKYIKRLLRYLRGYSFAISKVEMLYWDSKLFEVRSFATKCTHSTRTIVAVSI